MARFPDHPERRPAPALHLDVGDSGSIDVVGTRRGAHATLLEIEPEAPVRREDEA